MPRDANFQDILVPTIDTLRYNSLLEALLVHGFHVLCTGDTGTGKSVNVKQKLQYGMDKKFSNLIFLNFSAQTSANMTQDIVDGKLDKRRKGVFGPPLGCKAIIFVDDLNMPAKEIYGAQPPIEILRQWMDYEGWFDRKENVWRNLIDCQYVAAMGPPGGGRQVMSNRMLRHLHMLTFTDLSTTEIETIFTTITKAFLQTTFGDEVVSVAPHVVKATIGVYTAALDFLRPTVC